MKLPSAALALLVSASAFAQQPPPPPPPSGPPPPPSSGPPPPAYGQAAGQAPAQSPASGQAPAAGQPSGPAPAQSPQAQPPAGYTGTPPANQPPPPPTPRRQPVELFLALGFGNALCDNEKPDGDCPVDGAVTFGLGGAWRFHPHWALGGELAVWGFKVRDEWRGQLTDPPDEVTFTSSYLAPFFRWYWFSEGAADPYLQAGIGIGSLDADAKNAAGEYHLRAPGVVYPLAIGVEWQLADWFRLGPQLLAYLHVANQICEQNPGEGSESCRDPGKNDNGDREGLALPWRLVAVGTFTFGD